MTNELIAALEAADGPSRELDAQIAAATRYFPKDVGSVWRGGFRANSPELGRVECQTTLGTGGPHYKANAYTSSIDAAMTLVPGGCAWHISSVCPRDAFATIESGDDRVQDFTGKAYTPAIALVIAALRAGEA